PALRHSPGPQHTRPRGPAGPIYPPAVADLAPRAGQPLDVRLDAHPDDDDVTADRDAAAGDHPLDPIAAFEPLDHVVEMEANPLVAVDALVDPSDILADGALKGNLEDLHHLDVDAEPPERRRHLASDEP